MKAARRAPSARRSGSAYASEAASASSSGSESTGESSGSESDRDSLAGSEAGDGRRCGGCCTSRRRAGAPSAAVSSKSELEPPPPVATIREAALARKLAKIEALDEDEVPTVVWAPPSRSLAIERARTQEPRFKATNGRWYAYDVLRTTGEQVGRAFGAGYGAWFLQMELMQLLFAILTLFAVPAMYFVAWAAARNNGRTGNILGGRLLRWASYSTLGSIASSHEPDGNLSGVPPAAVTLIHSCLDIVATELFLIGLEYLRRRVRSQKLLNGTKRGGRAAVTLSPYSVIVLGLPRDLDAVDEVEDYFSRFGDVADVVLGTTATSLLKKERRHAAAADALEDFRAAVAKTGSSVSGRLQALQDRVDAAAADIKQFSQEPYACTCAFVTFETVEAAKEALTALTWYEFAFGSAELFRGKFWLRVRRAPEAADILWQSTCHTTASRLVRSMLASLWTITVIGIATFLVWWQAVSTPQLLRDVDCSQVVGTNSLFNTGRMPVTLDCTRLFPLNDEYLRAEAVATLGSLAAAVTPADCDPFIRTEVFIPDLSKGLPTYVDAGAIDLNATLAFLDAFSTKGACAAAVCHTCFCREHILEGAGGGFGGAVPADGVCDTYDVNLRAQDNLRYVILCICICAMVLLLMTMRPLSTLLERHSTRDALEGVCAWRMALSLVGAAYFVPLVGYAAQGRITDFSEAWYKTAGAITVCTTTFMALFLPAGLWLNAAWAKFSRSFVKRPLRQATLDKMCVLPRLQLGERYGVLLAVVFCALLVSPGCPFVYLPLQLYSIISVRTDRHVLFRLSSVPDPLSTALAERVMTLLPLSVWIHLLIGTWMLGTQTLPNYFMAWDPDPQADMADYSEGNRFALQHRLNRMNGLIFFVVFLIFSVWVAPITFWLRNAACCCGDSENPDGEKSAPRTAQAGDADEATSEGTCTRVVNVIMRKRRGPGIEFSYAFRKKMLDGLPSYRIVDNPDCLELISRSGVLSEVDLLQLQPFLERRVRVREEAAAAAAAVRRARRQPNGAQPSARLYAYPPISAAAAAMPPGAAAAPKALLPLLPWLPGPTWWPFAGAGDAAASAKIPGFGDAGGANAQPPGSTPHDAPPPPDRWSPLFERGESLRARGRLGEAEACLRRAYVSRLRVHGELHAGTLAAAAALAAVLQAQGRLADAEPLMRDTSRVRDSTLGAAHPTALSAANALGSCLYGQGKHVDAEAVFRRSLAGRTAALGAAHPETAVAASNLGSCLFAQARLAEAEVLYRQALQVRAATLTDKHPDTLASLASLGALLHAQGGDARLEEAEAHLRVALRGRRATVGNAHPDTLAAIASLACVLQDRGGLGEAERLHAECLRGRRAGLGEEHPDTLSALNNLAACLADQGRLAQAEPLYAQALRGLTSALGPQHPDSVAAARNLAALLEQLGALRAGDAPLASTRLVLLADKLRDLRLQRGSSHPEALTCANDLACALAEQGRAEEAEALFVEVLGARRTTLGPGHPATLTSCNNLGRLRLEQGALEEAELLLRTAVKGRAHHFGAADPDTAVAARNLQEALVAREHPDPAAAVQALLAAATRPRGAKRKPRAPKRGAE